MTELADEYLPHARTQLSNAISALVDEKPQSVTDDKGGATRIVWTQSLFAQLEEAIGGAQGAANRGASRSKPPLWVDAVDLHHEINQTIRTWWQLPTLDTPASLTEIDDAAWRPQDVPLLDGWSKQLRKWCTAIETLLSEERSWTVKGACPQCETVTVHRWIDGDRIQKPALHVTTKGCTCLNCHEVWPPERFQILAAALECAPIEGVVQ